MNLFSFPTNLLQSPSSLRNWERQRACKPHVSTLHPTDSTSEIDGEVGSLQKDFNKNYQNNFNNILNNHFNLDKA